MPRPKKKKVVESTESPSHKSRNLFDHLRYLTEGDNPVQYWNELTDAEKKEFSPYMINRWLSMNPDWTDFVDELQRLTIGPLGKKEVFRLYWEILPKGKYFFKYVKAKDAKTIPVALATILKVFFRDSDHNVRENYFTLMRTEEGKNFLRQLLADFGTQEAELKKIKKETRL